MDCPQIKGDTRHMTKTVESVKKDALQKSLMNIQKKFGDGAIMSFVGDKVPSIEVISTGSLSVDIALGVGGLPKGRIVEVYGPESAGKTTFCLHVVSEVTRRDGIVAFIDMEHALDPVWMQLLGIKMENVFISQPDTGEQAMEITEELIRSNAVDLVVVDSVAALVPRAEIEGEMGASHVGLQARLMSQALRKLAGTVKQTNTVLLFTNQLREKVGIMFGNPEVTPGGRALKFYASVRLDVRRVSSVKHANEDIGIQCKVTVKKNKVASPGKVANFDLMFAGINDPKAPIMQIGISREGEILDLATKLEIVQKRGAFFKYKEDNIGQGRENCKIALGKKPELALEIENAIRADLGMPLVTSIKSSFIKRDANAVIDLSDDDSYTTTNNDDEVEEFED